MAIKTFFSKDDQWNEITASASNAVNVNASFTTWDPAAIKWNEITSVPANININYPSTTVPGTTWVGGPLNDPYAPIGIDPMNQMIGCGKNSYDWIGGGTTWIDQYAFTKPAGVRPDVLMGFFSKYIHALLFVTDTSSYVIPFMERVGAIWLQKGPNKWVAYDKKEFYDFIDNPDVLIFTGTELNKREMQKTLANSESEEDDE